MKKVGIIDLGSNTIRLIVFSVKSTGDFRVLVNEKRVVGLSSYVENGKLTPAGIEKAADVLIRHIRLAHNVGCNDVRIFATAVIRNLSNKKRVVNALQKQVGLPIDILSGKAESHLGFIGAALSCTIKDGLLVDIGGGSTELAFIKNKNDYKNFSLDEGSVSSYARFVGKVIPLKREQTAIRKAFKAKLIQTKGLPTSCKGTLYGIGGSIRALAKLQARLHGSDKTPKELTLKDLQEITNLVTSDPSAFAHTATKAVPDRLHTIIPGCIILQEVMMHFKKDSIVICKYGVREGYLNECVNKPSKPTTKPKSKSTAKSASKQVSKPTPKSTSKQTSKSASKQTSKPNDSKKSS